MNWKKQLREEGFLEFKGFRIELTLDNTFMDLDYIPRIAVFWEGDGHWHVLRNPIPKGRTLEENWDNAVEVLERIIRGEEKPNFENPDVEKAFAEAIKALKS
ncbi:hypothetical protein A3K92_08450 [Thermococcus gorgonarius]|uniref:Uncharacterized protein n=2 Tax=Thermococcus gorgonarius TaxID=71997 RepID=A0A2Z2M7W3_THEGO|nr:hypothetical protein [Thermococcus gorgonarius]ASJ01746.1 hypothetical protein A3K92_08450 [Thermococcus gorgonarius]